jgi:hypothetical protein
MMRVACCSADISREKKPTDGAVDGLRAAVGAQIARPGVCDIRASCRNALSQSSVCLR